METSYKIGPLERLQKERRLLFPMVYVQSGGTTTILHKEVVHERLAYVSWDEMVFNWNHSRLHASFLPAVFPITYQPIGLNMIRVSLVILHWK